MKLNKIWRNIGVSALTAASIVTPIATVVSCGTTSKDSTTSADGKAVTGADGKAVTSADGAVVQAQKGGTLTVGIRAEDLPMWKPMAAAFKKATGTTVSFKFVASQTDNYKLWKSSKMIPNVTIADSGSAKMGEDEKWFEQLDLNSIATDPKYRIKSEGEFKEDENLKLDPAHFAMNMMDSDKSTNGKTYRAMPVIWGPNLLYAWKDIKDGNGKKVDLFDGKSKMKWFVPKLDDEGGVQVVKFDDSKKNPLVGADGKELTLSHKDIQTFLTNAGVKDQEQFTKWNGEAIADIKDANGEVISTGEAGYRQRLYSVGHSIYDALVEYNSHPKNPKEKVDLKNVTPFVNNLATDFTKLIQGQYKNGVSANQVKGGLALDDSAWQKDWDVKGTTIKDLRKSKLITQSFLTDAGYFNDDTVVTSIAKSEPDTQTVFAKHKSLFLPGAKWQFGGIKDKAIAEKYAETDLDAFSLPFQTAGVDGYAIASGLSASKSALAKQFLRFMMQKTVAAEISGDKAVSVLNAAKTLQAAEGDGFIAAAVANSGKPETGGFEDATYIYSKQSTDNVFDEYNNHFLQDEYDAYIKKTGHVITYKDWLERIISVNKTYARDHLFG